MTHVFALDILYSNARDNKLKEIYGSTITDTIGREWKPWVRLLSNGDLAIGVLLIKPVMVHATAPTFFTFARWDDTLSPFLLRYPIILEGPIKDPSDPKINIGCLSKGPREPTDNEFARLRIFIVPVVCSEKRPSSVLSVGDSLWKLQCDNEWTDCDLVLDEGHKIEVHKLILAAHSPVVATMLRSGMSETQAARPSIPLPSTSKAAALAIVRYLYTGRATHIERLEKKQKVMEVPRITVDQKADAIDKKAEPIDQKSPANDECVSNGWKEWEEIARVAHRLELSELLGEAAEQLASLIATESPASLGPHLRFANLLGLHEIREAVKSRFSSNVSVALEALSADGIAGTSVSADGIAGTSVSAE